MFYPAENFGLFGVIGTIVDIFNVLIGVLITLGLIYFLWGVAQYIIEQGNEEARKNARQMMINGIITLFVMVSVWGLVNVIVKTFGLTTTTAPLTPEIVR